MVLTNNNFHLFLLPLWSSNLSSTFLNVFSGSDKGASLRRAEVQAVPIGQLRPRALQEIRRRALLGSGLQRRHPGNQQFFLTIFC